MHAGSGGGQRAAIQRARIIEAMVQLVCERGYAETSVGSVIEQAKVSRRTFYELFDGLEECFLALLDEPAERHARAVLAGRRSQSETRGDSDRRLPPALRDPRAHRARGCLLYLAEHPGASNRQIAEGIGVERQAQMSSLLARLSDIGLLVKDPGAPGHANAWTLTPYGAHVLETVRGVALTLRGAARAARPACGWNKSGSEQAKSGHVVE